jgi:ribosomal protein S18 acetylase RimI-like enzyme
MCVPRMRENQSVADAITFEPFPSSDLAEWIGHTRQNYIDERVDGGDARAEVEGEGNSTIERLFPGGSPAPGQLVGQLISAEQAIGYLWIGIARTDPQRWWVWDVMIDEQFRGQGYGRQAMKLAEMLARREGALTLGLNVLGQNRVARALYTSLGYTDTAVQMRKAL